MISMLITSILNAILDPVLIGMIGFHGAAAATVISQIVSFVLLILYCQKKQYFHLKLSSYWIVFLVSNPGIVLTETQIFKAVWYMVLLTLSKNSHILSSGKRERKHWKRTVDAKNVVYREKRELKQNMMELYVRLC